MLPNVRLVPHPGLDEFRPCQKVGWVVPIDDTRHRIYRQGITRCCVNNLYIWVLDQC